MKNKYFNIQEFKYAIKNIDTNPILTKELLEKYLQKYPKDYSAYNYYASNLITLGHLEEAEIVIEALEYYMHNDKKFNLKVPKESQNKTKYNFLGTKLKLLSYQEKYLELYKFYHEHLEEFNQSNLEINHLIFYSCKQLGILKYENRDIHAYSFRQIIRYEENEFKEHIKKHFYDPNKDITEQNPCLFKTTFPFDSVLAEIKKLIPSDKGLYNNFYVDVYTFKYKECGYVNGKDVDYFKVVCFHNTSDILTIYPDEFCNSLPYTEINYQVSSTNNKTKKLSQIDKFNQKYKKI